MIAEQAVCEKCGETIRDDDMDAHIEEFYLDANKYHPYWEAYCGECAKKIAKRWWPEDWGPVPRLDKIGKA